MQLRAFLFVLASSLLTAADWPTYRSDNARSGAAKSDLKKDLGMAWEVKLTPPLSTTTTAAGLTFVSEVDKHTLHAFDAATGKPAWHFIAGGRIDSPPTYWKGRVFFGGKDGLVYCLRATDGALVWKFQAAPVMLSHGAWEMMESVWPVHGSVLVENGLVSCIAGHSCFLDGGLWFYRLDAKTGEMKFRENYNDRDPDTGGDLNDRHKTLQMPVALNDILSSDGKWTFLRTQKIGLEGKRVEVGPVSGDFDKQGGAHKGEGSHLFAPMGFLDDSNFHRSYWVYGKSFAGGHGGYFQAGKYAPAGRILVHDDKNVYSYGREAQYYKWTTTMEYTLFATPKAPPEQAYDTESATTERKGNSVVLDKDGKPLAVQPKGETQVGHSETLKAQAEAKKRELALTETKAREWEEETPVQTTAMRLIKAMATMATIDGYEIRQPDSAAVSVGQLSVRLIAEYRGAAFVGKALRIENRGTAPVVLREADLAPQGTLAVTIAKPDLAPGEATSAWLVGNGGAR